ncbi:hypothetical protein I1E95_16500 [Synechococcus sp. CBW1107]|uniref:hypothetical protein n=1 Tax=Synechococcus sp. CBW1107 TaxID=2789857 RepID=UPI0018CF643B|nr:hypothetical protein [Synechococcus sp. CBW1107]QPN56625.1 hypothetical protein I1E95_16500 [Synechococcus sp. CBW1107]
MPFRSSPLLVSAFLVLASTALGAPSVQAQQGRPNIDVSSMNRYCQGEAAASYKVSPRDISTLPVERNGNNYRVYGQTPADGSEALFFLL